MKDTEIFAQILHIVTPWSVSSIAVDDSQCQVTITIEWPKGRRGICPACQSECPIHDHRDERTWRHLDTMEYKTLLVCSLPRTSCKEHGIKSMTTPWAEPKSRFSLKFEAHAISVLLNASSTVRAAALLGLSWDEVHAVQKRAVDRGIMRRQGDQLTYIGIDEKSFLKGHSYASVLYDLKDARVLDMVKDRTEESAKALLECIPEEQRESIKAVAVDMWVPFQKAIEQVLPGADIVHDKFHIMGHLGKAIDEVRRKESKDLVAQGDRILKGSRYALLKNEENRSEEEQEKFKEIQASGLKVAKAWAMRDVFSGFWYYKYEKSARKYFDKWYFWVTHSKLKPVIKAAKMIKSRFKNVISYLHHGITNAVAEGLNSKIQAIKAAARGFRNFANYRIAVLFHCGGLSLYP